MNTTAATSTRHHMHSSTERAEKCENVARHGVDVSCAYGGSRDNAQGVVPRVEEHNCCYQHPSSHAFVHRARRSIWKRCLPWCWCIMCLWSVSTWCPWCCSSCRGTQLLQPAPVITCIRPPSAEKNVKTLPAMVLMHHVPIVGLCMMPMVLFLV